METLWLLSAHEQLRNPLYAHALSVTKRPRRVTHTGYNVHVPPSTCGLQDWLTLCKVLGSREYAPPPIHPAASAFSISFLTCTFQIGASRSSLSPPSRSLRRRARCILCCIDHCTALTCSNLSITSSDDVVEFAPGLGTTAKITLNQNPRSYTGIEQEKSERSD